MKNDVIKRKLARGAATTVVATAFVMPHNQTFDVPRQRPADDMAQNITRLSTHETRGSQPHRELIVQAPSPLEWDKHLEKEFRQLALLEAKGKLIEDGALRLEQLNRWRNELLCPPTSDDVLLRLKRDRLLSKMEILLREYVEFQESTHQKRFAS